MTPCCQKAIEERDAILRKSMKELSEAAEEVIKNAFRFRLKDPDLAASIGTFDALVGRLKLTKVDDAIAAIKAQAIEDYKKNLTREDRMSLAAVFGFEAGEAHAKRDEARIRAEAFEEAAKIIRDAGDDKGCMDCNTTNEVGRVLEATARILRAEAGI